MAQLILWGSYDAPHTTKRAVGSYQLANWLKIHGYTVKVIDFCHAMSTDDLVEITKKHIDSTTIAVGVSNTFWSHRSFFYRKQSDGYFEPDWVINARDKLETSYGNRIQWLLGGPYTATIPPNSLKFDWELFYGFAEDKLLQYMDEKTNNRPTRTPFDVQNISAPFLNEHGIQSTEVLPIELSRGCQFKCTFCRFPLLGKKKNTYLRNFQTLEHELLNNYENFGVTRYSFMDDTFNESYEKVEALANIASRLPFKLEWVGFNRLDLIGSRPATVDLLKDSGMKSCHFGIETFHKQASKMIGKGWNGVHGKEFLLELKEKWGNDVNYFMSFIVGLANETEQDIDDTHQWCIDNDVAGWTFYPLGIKPDAKGEWTSVFDTNYADYGYRFPNPMKREDWESDYWTWKSAKEKADSLMSDCQNHERPSGYLLGELASIGYSFDELMNIKKKDIKAKDIIRKNRQFVSNYVKGQLK